MLIETSIDVPLQRVCDLFVGAMEGGSNHWLARLDYVRTPPAKSRIIYSPDKPILPCGARLVIVSETAPEVAR